MAFPLLPSLKTDSKVAIPKNGEWTISAQNTLSGLVEGLKVAANKKSNISSIPDIWARPILMQSILGDSTHPKYEQCVAEWRGLMAIMALRKMRGLSHLHIANVEIPATDRLHDDDPVFLKVLARSLPMEYLQMQNDDTIKDKTGIQAKIQLLTYDEHPVGIFWPSILICPALELATYHPIDIPWWSHEGIIDPISSLSNDEKNALYAWLQQIIDQVPQNSTILPKLLSSFRDDIKENLGEFFKESVFQPQEGTMLGVTGVCSLVDRPIIGIVDDDFLKKSQVLLMNQRGNENIANLLVVTPDLDEQWNVSASEIIVGGFINASICLHKGTGIIVEHQRLGDIDLSEYNAEIHMADEFFTNKITVFYLPYNAFPAVMGNKVYDYRQAKVNVILPVRKWLLDYLEPEFIARNTRISVINQDIEVTMSLPVSGPDGNGKLMTTKKVYKAAQRDEIHLDKKEEILSYDSVPLIQVWPNIRLREPNEWKAYYTYFDLGDISIPFHATPIFKNGVADEENLPDTSAEICKGESFPEAFVCEHESKDLYGKLNQEEVGLLLLDQSQVKEVSTQTAKCKIGIDFGTTNTTAYMLVDNEMPKLMRFKNHKYYVTFTGGAENLEGGDKDSLRRNFISEQDQPSDNQSSIKTMYHANPERVMASPFFSGNIYYIDQSQNIDADRGIMGNIKTTDMKWDQVKGRVYMQGFLMQLCLQCMVEAVETGANTFEWLYSYPKAFSLMQRNQYQSTWKAIYDETIQTACTLNSVEPSSLSESESVAEYFKKDMKASTARGIVCLDIGGGTTDIAVWQGSDDALLNQTSIRFAGRNVLNDYLWNRQQNGHAILSKLTNGDSDFTMMLKSLESEDSQNGFDLKLEALLRDYEEDIFKSLPTKSADPEIALLIRDISFALAGIFFYSGMLIGYLRQQGKCDINQLLPNCYVGGNASKLLNWAAGGEFSSKNIMSAVLRQCMYSGITAEDTEEKLKNNFTIEMTEHPKQEVAYGLVTSSGSDDDAFDFGLDDDEADGTILLAGEKFTVESENRDSRIITAADFLEGVHIDNESPELFKKFISLFNKIMRKMRLEPIDFTDNDFINICTNVNQELSDIKQEANGDVMNIKAEPIFILVLKEAYRYLSSQK